MNSDALLYDRLLRFLRREREKRGPVMIPAPAIVAAAKESKLSLSDEKIREAVHALRIAGQPIASSATKPAGYLFAVYRDELEHTRASLLSRETKIREAREALERTMRNLPERPGSSAVDSSGKEAA